MEGFIDQESKLGGQFTNSMGAKGVDEMVDLCPMKTSAPRAVCLGHFLVLITGGDWTKTVYSRQ